jgi:hypothetical protein
MFRRSHHLNGLGTSYYWLMLVYGGAGAAAAGSASSRCLSTVVAKAAHTIALSLFFLASNGAVSVTAREGLRQFTAIPSKGCALPEPLFKRGEPTWYEMTVKDPELDHEIRRDFVVELPENVRRKCVAACRG